MIKSGRLILVGFVALSLLLLSTRSFAAIAEDSTTNGSNGEATSNTVSHTITGSDLILIVCIGTEDNFQPTHTDVTDVTWNGTSITETTSGDTIYKGSGDNRVDIWYKIGPATGTHDVVVSFDASVNSSNQIITSLTGTDQTDLDDDNDEATGNSSTASVTVTAVTADSWGIDCAGTNVSSTDLTPGSGQTQLGTDGSTGQRTIMTYETGGGSIVLTETLGTSDEWGTQAIVVDPSGAAANTTTTLHNSTIQGAVTITSGS